MGEPLNDEDMAWRPNRISKDPSVTSIGVDMTTGEPVTIPSEEGVMVSGATGSGKSYALRALAASAVKRGVDVSLVDPRGEEAEVWSAVCPVAIEPKDILELVDERHDLMEKRLAEMREKGLQVWDGQRKVLVVDEGVNVLALLKCSRDRVEKLERLGIAGRAAGTPLWWSTGNPVPGGSYPGITSDLRSVTGTRIALRTTSRYQSEAALGAGVDPCAAHLIKRDQQGHGYLAHYPGRIRLWRVDDDTFRTLRD